ncbi:MAG: nucleoside deaminase [Haloarculaceae archaeon]
MWFDDFDHEAHVRRAIELGREAAERGDDPYGSVLVREDRVVMEARNAVVTEADLAAHPELALARRAARELEPDERAETVMYTSTEPCPMCAGGVYHAGLGGVVYSVSAERSGELGTDLVVPSGRVFAGGSREVPVVGPVCESAGLALRREYG